MFDLILKISGHFIFILLCILLFFAPFYGVFRIRHRRGRVKRSLNEEIEAFFMSKELNFLILFWAMGEALIWFVIPEFLLLLVVFMRIKRKQELLIYDVAGTILGTIIAFTLHLSNHAINSLPYVYPKMVDQTIAWYEKSGIWGLFYQPFSGVPYKVFTLTADRQEFFLIGFLLLAVLVRMSRYLIFFGFFVGIYPALHKFVRKNYAKLFILATFIFSVLLVKVSHTFH